LPGVEDRKKVMFSDENHFELYFSNQDSSAGGKEALIALTAS
jgi:hypothetical protein